MGERKFFLSKKSQVPVRTEGIAPPGSEHLATATASLSHFFYELCIFATPKLVERRKKDDLSRRKGKAMYVFVNFFTFQVHYVVTAIVSRSQSFSG